MSRRKRFIDDLEPYDGCDDEAQYGLTPLGVGFIVPGQPFVQGNTSAAFQERLLLFCLPPNSVCRQSRALPCPICRKMVTVENQQLGAAEMRAVGVDDVYAAPDLIYHYVSAHNYQPPDPFVEAVVDGPQPDSIEHRALISALS